ncbi:LapA family protein [Limosilactobacillus sp. WF-MT5-A]|uniref:LapA family protein n=1 Tax=Limosilactobacillus agrestis TaxID=2759748 RepID=UPI0015F87B10|nr:LapA family protein [Limosilactobacillus agrestis]MBB1100044.1 LapA family protein [Limosilactobacillus agrestis]MCD7127172.1 LapA family protein [Limosilactobacillus agrestis]
MKKQSTTIASIVILIIIAIFALLNTATVVVNFFGAQVKMPLVLLIFICLLIGAIIIYLLSFSNHLKTSRQLKELQSSRVSKDELKKSQKKVEQLQKENTQLKQQLKNQTTAEKIQDPSAN